MDNNTETLSEKEKETLRLILRGHDAKSMARQLDLSVHTINDRLRAARRKLGVTSSREAARVLAQHERSDPDTLVRKQLGNAPPQNDVQDATASRAGIPPARAIKGIIVMSVLIAAIALATLTPAAHDPAVSTTIETQESDEQTVARRWLELADAGNWSESYRGTASAFREANTLRLWSDTAKGVQAELGATLSRQFIGRDDVPSPQGITIVKFRTDFANRSGVLETVSLVREDGAWKVAGIYVS